MRVSSHSDSYSRPIGTTPVFKLPPRSSEESMFASMTIITQFLIRSHCVSFFTHSLCAFSRLVSFLLGTCVFVWNRFPRRLCYLIYLPIYYHGQLSSCSRYLNTKALAAAAAAAPSLHVLAEVLSRSRRSHQSRRLLPTLLRPLPAPTSLGSHINEMAGSLHR